jgi:hypothetical protein
MSTTVDRPGSDSSTPSIKSRRAARRARTRRLEVWQTVLLSTFVALVIAANLFVGAVVIFGSVKSQLVTYSEPTAVRTGKMTEMLLDGTFCRTIVFDNKSAETVKDKVDLCDQPGLFSSGGKSRFNWGRQ